MTVKGRLDVLFTIDPSFSPAPYECRSTVSEKRGKGARTLRGQEAGGNLYLLDHKLYCIRLFVLDHQALDDFDLALRAL